MLLKFLPVLSPIVILLNVHTLLYSQGTCVAASSIDLQAYTHLICLKYTVSQNYVGILYGGLSNSVGGTITIHWNKALMSNTLVFQEQLLIVYGVIPRMACQNAGIIWTWEQTTKACFIAFLLLNISYYIHA
jgi:hypothetical protein